MDIKTYVGAEFEYLIGFCQGLEEWGASREDLEFQQLRCLWTAYCFHANLDVDTAAYDQALSAVWEEVKGKQDCFVTDEEFDSFMGELLC